MNKWVTRIFGSFLLLWASGPVSSAAPQLPQPGAPAAAPAATDLPWKPVAGPEGVLPLTVYTVSQFRSFGDKDNFANTQKVVEAVLNETVRKSTSPILKKKDLVYAIHVVIFGDPVATGDQSASAAPVQSDSWYLYHNNISFEEFAGQRVFGSNDVVVLFLHVNARGLTGAGLDSDNCQALRARASATPCTAAETTTAAANRVFLGTQNLVDQATGRHLKPIGDGAAIDAYSEVHYEAAVVKKVAANIQHLFSAFKLLGLVAQGAAAVPPRRAVTEPVILWGSGAITTMRVPSDIYVAGYAQELGTLLPPEKRDGLQIGAQAALDNEGLYWWDVSIGIPVHKIRDVDYSSADGTVEAKQVDKQSAYAMFDVMFKPVDIKNPRSNLMPRLLVGFPLSSSPWDRLFVGGGFGIPKLMLGNQFFAGVVFNRVSRPQTLGPGDAAGPAALANDSRLQVERKLMIGINVPIMKVFDQLK